MKPLQWQGFLRFAGGCAADMVLLSVQSHYRSNSMYEEPNENQAESASDPAGRAREKADEFRMHAELFAVFEGTRKFDAEIRPGLDADLARQIQRSMGKLEKAKELGVEVIDEAELLRRVGGGE